MKRELEPGGRAAGERSILERFISLGALALLLGAGGCATAPPLAPVNLKQPGWTVHEGQAVWTRKAGGAGVAGEVLVGTREDGRGFVQFTKAPFPLVVGQVAPHRWSVEFPPQNRHYSGRGEPPQRIIWLYLPKVLAGQAPPENWVWHQDSDGWRLENSARGESVEGYFNQ